MDGYRIVIETTETGFSAYSPDVPGCIATGTTEEEVMKNMSEALEFHFEGMKEDGLEIPEPHSHAHYLAPTV